MGFDYEIYTKEHIEAKEMMLTTFFLIFCFLASVKLYLDYKSKYISAILAGFFALLLPVLYIGGEKLIEMKFPSTCC